MKKHTLIAIMALALVACETKKDTSMALQYPETARVDSPDTYFGNEVPDPYRWLEDDRSPETEDWVTRQNEVTFGYLESIPFREDLKNRLTTLWNYEKLSTPFKEGDFTYFYKNDGLQDQSVVYRALGEGEPEVFLDPNKFSEDGTTSLAGLSFSKDGSLAAYSISEGGSDWRKVIVMDAIRREIVEDTLRDVKFSGISWKGNEGFYYSSYDKPDGSELSAKTDQHKVYFHRLGQPQAQEMPGLGQPAPPPPTVRVAGTPARPPARTSRGGRPGNRRRRGRTAVRNGGRRPPAERGRSRTQPAPQAAGGRYRAACPLVSPSRSAGPRPDPRRWAAGQKSGHGCAAA